MLMQFSEKKRERDRSRNIKKKKKWIDAEKSGKRTIHSSLNFNYKHNNFMLQTFGIGKVYIGRQPKRDSIEKYGNENKNSSKKFNR